MAEVVEDMPIRARGRRSAYPWPEWMDGQTRIITRGVDFPETVKATTMRTMLYQRAYKSGKKVTAYLEGRVGNEDRIRFRFYDAPAGEAAE